MTKKPLFTQSKGASFLILSIGIGKQTQTECLQPPASSLGNIVSDPDYFKVIKRYIPPKSIRTLSLTRGYP